MALDGQELYDAWFSHDAISAEPLTEALAASHLFLSDNRLRIACAYLTSTA